MFSCKTDILSLCFIVLGTELIIIKTLLCLYTQNYYMIKGMNIVSNGRCPMGGFVGYKIAYSINYI